MKSTLSLVLATWFALTGLHSAEIGGIQVDAKQNYLKLAPLLAKIGKNSEFTLHVGMSRGFSEIGPDGKEPKKVETALRHEHHFHQQPAEVSKEDAAKLQGLIKDRNSFVPFSGYKLCGGFHPDFSLVWKEGESIVEILICFGCHEMKAYHGDVLVYCDINGPAYGEFKKLLMKYQR